MMQGKSVRALRIGFEKADQSSPRKGVAKLNVEKWPDDVLNFQWQEGDKPPALEEFA